MKVLKPKTKQYVLLKLKKKYKNEQACQKL